MPAGKTKTFFCRLGGGATGDNKGTNPGYGGGAAGTRESGGAGSHPQPGTQTTGYAFGAGQAGGSNLSVCDYGCGGSGGGYFGGYARPTAVEDNGGTSIGNATANTAGAGGSGFVYGLSSTAGASGGNAVPSGNTKYRLSGGGSLQGTDAAIPVVPRDGNGYFRVTFLP
ncbi:MAG: hypothetical protein Ta2F_18970 [Termitinemataceae bacterium]|nr:MAG: hypothetical protein Ta2F_18970 [Termitinemataceae bacterium]